MGSSKGKKTPDPTPVATVIQADGTEAKQAAQDERRRIQTQNGRSKTILAGDLTQAQPVEKRSLLGGE
jgi:hypothetical protein